ncbi:MAG: xanthine dehydrogenase family protein molybdopterin-binding subunit [Burkholderiales bacterium]|nr:xanthine dehydrogenase family protein molybdopterin-binding subunit [Burkholderiales bacterium]
MDAQRYFDVGGMRALRLEDPRLITGRGQYAADWNLDGQLHAVFLRSDRAHARIVKLDCARARSAPGVRWIATGEDAVRAGFIKAPHQLTFIGVDGRKARVPDRPALAHERVRYVGEPVAMVVAERALQAQDAAAAIDVTYQDLPAAIGAEHALSPQAPRIHDDVPGNLALELEVGDRAAVDAVFARAHRITRLKVDCTRVTPSPMEPRACLSSYDQAHDCYTIRVCLQGINTMKQQIAAYMNLDEAKMRVIGRDVGGGFGQRSTVYPEYCMSLHAAKVLGRPVKWVSSRSESFMTDTHGRANIGAGELAMDANGRFLALRFDWITDQGGYVSSGGVGYIRNIVNCLTGVYAIPLAHARFRVALTNTGLVASFRGAGRPDIAYAVERLVQQAAADVGLDAVALRRRNFIAPHAFPYRTATGTVYEMADLPGLLEEALARADWAGFERRRAAASAQGKLRGIGISTVIEASGAGTAPRDEVLLEVAAGGKITAYSASHSQGQGHETTLAMIIGAALGIAPEQVVLRQAVDEKNLAGNATNGSRTMVGAGSVCKIAAERLIERGRALAAEEFAVEPSQVDYSHGVFRERESARMLTLAEVAQRGEFSARGEGTFGSTWPNGCHIAEVEIDAETGKAEIAAYVAVDDCGVVINHSIVEGQIHGAVTQGAGQVFGEHVVYDRDSGQLLTGSFMDYVMPRAGWVREIRMAERPTPSTLTPLGVKGAGEAGCTASLGALSNAVHDALRPLGIGALDMPLTAAKLWGAITAARNHLHRGRIA